MSKCAFQTQLAPLQEGGERPDPGASVSQVGHTLRGWGGVYKSNQLETQGLKPSGVFWRLFGPLLLPAYLKDDV